MRRKLILAVTFVAALGIAMFAGTNIISALDRQTYTATYSLKAGGLNRSYKVIAPVAALPDSAPIIVVLSGINAPVDVEIKRDFMVPYAAAGLAELVYPVAYQMSWNAGGCCGKAASQHVDDMAFMHALVAVVDPGHRHPLVVVGYSNGGRLAYEMACGSSDPFDETVIVKAMPDGGCALRRPMTILQVDSLNDPFIPYQPGDQGIESPPATVQNASLRALDGCSGAPIATRLSAMTYTTWSCRSGQRVGFAVWDDEAHSFPYPERNTPAASQVIWAFFTKTQVAPLPR
jgi:polyhydroxybutyrate depolymerase